MNEYDLIENYFKKLSKNNPASKNLNDDVFYDQKNNLVIYPRIFFSGTALHFLISLKL